VQPKNAIVSAVARIPSGALTVCVGLAVLLTACSERKDHGSARPVIAHEASDNVDQRLQRMAGVAGELKSSPEAGRAGQHVGELWIQTAHLKREGINTKNVEGLLSDLEGNLRRSQQDPSARRHLANGLEHEIETLKRRNR
jgi:hypothetical protein